MAENLPFDRFLLFLSAASGRFFPTIDEKFTAQLSKKFPLAITAVFPPPPSFLIQESTDLSRTGVPSNSSNSSNFTRIFS